MLRWNLMLRTLFGSRCQRPLSRRTQTTKKLNLESLEDRTMPSASPANPTAFEFVASPPSLSTAAAAVSHVASTIDQLGHLIETVEQGAIGIVQTLDQRIAQEMAAVSLQLAHFFGINASTSSPSTASRPRPGNGSDSGAMLTTHGNNSINGASKVHPLTGSGDPQMWFETNYTQVAENSGTCDNVNEILMVTLSAPSSQTVTATYTTSDQTAYAGIDYTYENGTVTFAPGQTVQSITIPILDDGTDENGSGESFNVTLSNPNGATLGDPSVCQVNIMENHQQQATDTLEWSPCPDDGDDASTVTNWYDVTQGFQLPAGSIGPNPSSPIIFDGAQDSQTPNDDSPIIWDDPKLPSWTLENGYNKQQTIDPGDTIELTGPDGTSLSMDASSWLVLAFGSSTSTFKIDNNATITNMQLGGNYLADFEIAGGTTSMAEAIEPPPFTETLGVQFKIDSGAKVDYQSNNTLQLTHDNVKISVYGELDFHWGQNNDIPQNTNLISGGGTYSNDYIDVESGLLVYYGRQNVVDTISIPINMNGGTFNVTVNSVEKPLQGTLIVQGGNASTGNVSVNLNANALVTLDNYDTLECDNGFNAVYGTLKTLDNTSCTLQIGAGSTGTATIGSSSVVWIDSKQNSYGTLNVKGNLNLGGELNVSMDASNPGTCDLLNVVGTTNLQGNANLYVFVYNGPPAAGQGPWIIIKDTGGAINGNFAMPINTQPQTNLTAQVDPKNPNQYILNS